MIVMSDVLVSVFSALQVDFFLFFFGGGGLFGEGLANPRHSNWPIHRLFSMSVNS